MAWLEGWNNIMRLTVDSSNIDSILTDFPILITLSSGTGLAGDYDATSVFDELGSSSKKIAITTADGETQCPVEVEYWDDIEEVAYLWTKVPTVYSSNDTTLYLYYDATMPDNEYVGDVTDIMAQVVLELAAEGTYDTDSFWEHSVLKCEDGSYKMWYDGYDGSDFRILYCDSDDGINWYNHEMVIDKGDEGTYDVDSAFSPKVIKDGSIYKMWYTGTASSVDRILYAESPNGTTWSGHQMVIDRNEEGTYDTDDVRSGSVIKDGSIYKIWYAGRGVDFTILYASSSDGISWANHQMVIDKGDEGTYDTDSTRMPCVIKNDSGYKMWYTGDDGTNYRIIYAESTNGTSWTNHELNINLSFEGTADDKRVYSPTIVVEDENLYKMWYLGENNSSGVRKAIHTQSFDRGQNWIIPSQSVWSNGYFSVYHMNQDPSSSDALDSTSSQQDLEFRNMDANDLVDGRIGQASYLDGGDDYIQSNTYGPSGNFSFEAIIKIDLISSSQVQRIMCNNSAPNGKHFSLDIRDQIGSGGSAELSFWVDDNTANQIIAISPDAPIEEDVYYYVAGTFDEGGTVRCFVNDALKDTTVNTSFGTYSSDRNIRIGCDADGLTNFFDGILDEIRISTTERTSAWVKATYYSNFNQLLLFDPFSYVEGECTDRYGVHIDDICYVTALDDSSGNILASTTAASGTGLFSMKVFGREPGQSVLVVYSYPGTYKGLDHLAGAEYMTTLSGTTISGGG